MSLQTRLTATSALLLIMSVCLDARPSSLPSASQFESWTSIRGKSICRAHVAFEKFVQLNEVWCADDVEGHVFEADGEFYACRTVRLSVPFQDSDIDVAAGCVAVREGKMPDAWMAIDFQPRNTTSMYSSSYR